MSSIGSFDLCRLCESARVSVVRCCSQNLTCFCSCCRLPPAHTAPTRWDEWVIRAAASCLQMLVLPVSGFSSTHTTHTHTHALVLRPTHILSHLWLFAGVFCVSSSCWLCKGAHALTVTQMSEAPLTEDKVGEGELWGVRLRLQLVLSSQMGFLWPLEIAYGFDLIFVLWSHVDTAQKASMFSSFKLSSDVLSCSVLHVFFICASHASRCQSGKPEKS